MAIISINIGACRTRAQLAAGLNAPPAALDLVTLTSKHRGRIPATMPARRRDWTGVRAARGS